MKNINAVSSVRALGSLAVVHAGLGAAGLMFSNRSAEAGNRVLQLGTAASAANTGFVSALDSPVQSGEMTIEFWLRLEPSAPFGRPFNIRGCSCSGITIQANVVGQSGRLTVELGGLGVWDSAGFSLSTWHHFAVVWSRTQGVLRAYLDGAAAGQTSLPTGAMLSSCQSSLRFGEQCGRGMVGAMDNVRYWSTARTEAQVHAEMHRQYTNAEAQLQAGLIGSWTFEDGAVSNPTGLTPSGTLEGGAAIAEENFFQACTAADIYRDYQVNGADLAILLSQWGPDTPLTESDLDDDGAVTGADLAILLSFWGPCP